MPKTEHNYDGLSRLWIYVDASQMTCIRCNQHKKTREGVLMPFNPGEYEFYCWDCVEEIYNEVEGAME